MYARVRSRFLPKRSAGRVASARSDASDAGPSISIRTSDAIVPAVSGGPAGEDSAEDGEAAAGTVVEASPEALAEAPRHSSARTIQRIGRRDGTILEPCGFVGLLRLIPNRLRNGGHGGRIVQDDPSRPLEVNSRRDEGDAV